MDPAVQLGKGLPSSMLAACDSDTYFNDVGGELTVDIAQQQPQDADMFLELKEYNLPTNESFRGSTEGPKSVLGRLAAVRPASSLSKWDLRLHQQRSTRTKSSHSKSGAVKSDRLYQHDEESIHSTRFDPEPELLLEPENHPISHEQLVAEVKVIYTDLFVVEAKCIDIDVKQSAATQDRNRIYQTQEKWQTLMALHQTLLQEHHDFSLVSQHPSASPAARRLAAKYSLPPRMWKHGIHALRLGTGVRNQISKIKRGLSGFVNGSKKSALADTGAKHNFMSADYAKEAGLEIEVSPSSIKIGNSKKIQSIGSQRVTECIFSVVNVFHFNFLDNNYQFLEGTLGDTQTVLASPDTGAERNVMNMQYAMDHGFDIQIGPEHYNYLQFADGSIQKTVGQVSTHWTFASGERIPLTFEILENCCSDVILGEDFLWDYNVFEEHQSSIVTLSFESDSIELAPFSFHKEWQKRCDKVLTKFKHRTGSLFLSQF
ncbi:MAG: hypothetical protein Q9187_003275 [Circinaria calcarea]